MALWPGGIGLTFGFVLKKQDMLYGHNKRCVYLEGRNYNAASVCDDFTRTILYKLILSLDL